MGERLFYFWLRFRWFIVAGALLVTVGGGSLAGTFSGSSDETGSPSSSTPVSGAREAMVIADGDDALDTCAKETDRAALYACRLELTPRSPVILRADGAAFLVDGAWMSIDGTVEAFELDGGGVLDAIVSGFTADLDNDGSAEYVLVTRDGRINVFSRGPGGRYRDTAAARGLDRITDVDLILPADADGDGWLDLVISGTVATGEEDQGAAVGAPIRSVEIIRNQGWRSPGLFDGRNPVRLGPVGADGAGQVLRTDQLVDGYVGDLDLDGYVDVVLLDRRGILTIQWGGEGLTTWAGAAPLQIQVPVGGTGLAVGDLDLDGARDLLVSYDVTLGSAYGTLCRTQLNGRPCALYPGLSLTGGVAVLRQTTSRSFSPAVDLAVSDIANASDVVVVDLDGDARPEIVIGRESLNDAEDVAGGAVVAEATTDASGRVVAYTRGDVLGNGAVGRLRAADLDNDGGVDIIMTGRGKQLAQVWRNSSAPTRYLRLDLRGAGRLDVDGTSLSGLGAIVTINDLDNRIVTVTVGSDDLVGGLSVALPLVSGAWSGNEAVPRIEVRFPTTGRSTTLANVASSTTVTVDEPSR